MKLTQYGVLLALEVAFVVVGLVGVGLVYVPAALVLGGVLGVWAVEREMAGLQAAEKQKEAKT